MKFFLFYEFSKITLRDLFMIYLQILRNERRFVLCDITWWINIMDGDEFNEFAGHLFCRQLRALACYWVSNKRRKSGILHFFDSKIIYH